MVSIHDKGAAPVGVEPAPSAPDVQERVLGDLLGLGAVPDHAQHQPEDAGGHRVVQAGEGLLVAAAAGLEQVRQLADGGARRGAAPGTGPAGGVSPGGTRVMGTMMRYAG